MIKRILKYLIFLLWGINACFIDAKAQGNSLNIQITVPPSADTISVCLDSFSVTLTIVNTEATATIDSLIIQHHFPAGIDLTGFNASPNINGIDTSNTNIPIFFLDSLATGDTLILDLFAFADCDFQDSVGIDSTIIFYQVNNNNFFQSDVSGSYNVEAAVLNIQVIFNQNITANIGDIITPPYSPIIQICNNGFGSLSEFVFSYVVEPEIKIDSFEVCGFDSCIIITDTGGTIFFDSTLLNTINGDGLLTGGEDECVTITEFFTVISCTPVPDEPETQYTASWGCSGQTCQSVEANANVTVKAYEPIIKVTTDTTFTPTNYCTTDTGTLNFTYTNTSNTFVIPGDAVATDLVVVVRWDRAFVDIMDIRIDGAPVSSIPGVSISGIQNTDGDARDSTFFYDLSAVPASFSFPGGNIIDIDRDGFVDDILIKKFYYI